MLNLQPLLDVARLVADLDPAKAVRALAYLRHFEHVGGSPLSGRVHPEAAAVAVEGALRGFQAMAGVPETGRIDEPTLEAMDRPRCGNSDRLEQRAEEARWRKDRLTYYVAGFVEGLSRDDQIGLIRLAWDDWQAVARLELAPATQPAGADIIINVGRGAGQGFDGPSGTLAWAQLPTGTDRQLLMRFDLSEQWVKDQPRQQREVLFRNVACHEFGHLLGLDHSRRNTALMAPFYSPRIAKPQPDDDVRRIQALYGPPTQQPPPPPPAGAARIVLDLDAEGRVRSVAVPASVPVTRT